MPSIPKGSMAWPCALHLHSEPLARLMPDLVTYGAVMSCCRFSWRWALRLLGELMLERIEAVAWWHGMVGGLRVAAIFFWAKRCFG